MSRFFLAATEWGSATLTGDEAKHFAQVLRGRAGDTITVFDGAGRRAEAEVLHVSKHEVSLKLGEPACPAPPRPVITLAQAVPKGKNMDLIVQKAVELGVARIQPLVTRNTVVQPGQGKPDKWRRTALEACKQCGQDTMPEVTDAKPFDDWLANEKSPGLRIIASLAPGARPMREVLRDHPGTREVILLVGPEGDFAPEETEAALAAGFLPITLGDIVLRVETASLFCVSALRYEFA